MISQKFKSARRNRMIADLFRAFLRINRTVIELAQMCQPHGMFLVKSKRTHPNARYDTQPQHAARS